MKPLLMMRTRGLGGPVALKYANLTANVVKSKGASFSKGGGVGQDYQSVVLADNPVGYWRLDETSGLPQDISGNNFDASTITAGVGQDQPSLVPDGKSININNTADHIQIDANPTLNAIKCVEFWFKPTGRNAYSALVSNAASNSQSGIFVRHHGNGSIEFGAGNGDSNFKVVGPIVANDEVVHIVAGWDWGDAGVAPILYVNNVPVTGVQSGTWNTNSPIRIGDSLDIFWTNMIGFIDEVAVYGEILTAQQVANHFNAGNGVAITAVSYQGEIVTYQGEDVTYG